MFPSISAVVLAGGRSVRMGTDKAVLQVDGVPLWQRQARVLRAAGADEILLSARTEQAWSSAPPTAELYQARVEDVLPNGGPLAGILAAFAYTQRQHLAVMAIDLPRMTAAWWSARFRDIGAGPGVVAQRDGYFEPLAAVYPRSVVPVFTAALHEGRRALQPLIAQAVAAGQLRVHPVTADEAVLFENWNAPGSPSRADDPGR